MHDVLPDGCMDLIWSDGALVVAGPDTGSHAAPREPGGIAAGLRFAPGALPGLLGVPAAALRDQRVPLAELHPRLARRAESRLGADRPGGPRTASDLRSGLVAVALVLPGDGADHAAPRVAARIGRGAGVRATADDLGCTTRTLHRRCLDSFGYGPAMLRRILRFRRATALLHAGTALAEVAAAAGYADQPHLSREVRRFAGVTPGQLRSGENRSTPVPSGSWTTA